MEKICRNCRYFAPDEKKPRCMVPIWKDARLYNDHETKPAGFCNLFEEKADGEEQEM